MAEYKVEYLPTSPDHPKWYKQKSVVDGWTLSKELEACLAEYAGQGFRLSHIESMITTDSMNRTKTDGILVILEKPAGT